MTALFCWWLWLIILLALLLVRCFGFMTSLFVVWSVFFSDLSCRLFGCFFFRLSSSLSNLFLCWTFTLLYIGLDIWFLSFVGLFLYSSSLVGLRLLLFFFFLFILWLIFSLIWDNFSLILNNLLFGSLTIWFHRDMYFNMVHVVKTDVGLQTLINSKRTILRVNTCLLAYHFCLIW